jgi:GNAT superfamily N-acetyltransferase
VGGLVVRRADTDELEALAAFRWRWGEEADRVAGVDRAAFVAAFVAWAEAHADSHIPFVAVRDGVPIGMAWLARVPRVPTPRAPDRVVGDVQSVFVAPEERAAGVGGALVEALLGEARALGAERVVVHSSPRAVPMYERGGFAVAPVLLQVELTEP